MRKRVVAASAAFILGPLSVAVYASVPTFPVEQIEAYINPPTNTQYAPVDFGGSPTITLGVGAQGGHFPNITFQALTNTSTGYTSILSSHAYSVGVDMYGSTTVAYPYITNPSVTNVFCQAADDFLANVVKPQPFPGNHVAPGNFSTGVKVVNNSYVADYGTGGIANINEDTDAYRRMDYMINKCNVTFTAGAVSVDSNGNATELDWSCFNSIAVSGVQTFSPTGGPGKPHADLYMVGDASFNTATVSSYAIGLYGQAMSASQTDATQNFVNRSFIMAGTQNNANSGLAQTANHLDPIYGAGSPSYDTSLAILQAGEKPLLTVSSNTSTGTPSQTQQGWAYGTIAATGKDVVLFSSPNAITGLTASLNWNVTSNASGGNINTSSLQFPNLTLQVVPVTAAGGGTYTLGANQSNAALYSIATGDNIQYLHESTTTLPAGTYAFVIGGDHSLSWPVGFSYTLAGSFASQWNNSAGSSWGTIGNWTSGVPNGQGAQANFLASPGLTAPGTITLDGDRTVGQLTFNNANSYNISTGSGGTLTIDDTGDSSGTANPLITVTSGSHLISAPISIVNGLTFNIAAAASLNLSSVANPNGNIVKEGAGTLTITNTTNALLGHAVYGTLSITGGTLALAASSTPATRQYLVAAYGLTISGVTDNWTGKLDLNNSDLDYYRNGDLSTVTNQVKEGFNNGKWNGSGGILSTAAANDTTHLTALGVIQNNQSGTALFTSSNLFDGGTPNASDVLIKYTYYGDTNLDGRVDGSDYSRIDAAYLADRTNPTAMTGWFNGDFNYDGLVNGSDYTLIDNAFNSQRAIIEAMIASPSVSTTAQISAVPEPGPFLLTGMAAVATLARRRRSV